jgi:hypothetical protein
MTVLLARMLVAAMFVVAGAAKLADRRGVRRMLVQFGSPPLLAPPLAWVLAGTELGVALALLLEPSARLGGLGAVVLLVVFGAAVAVNLRRGRRPECRCFGGLRAHETGWSTVARNALLASVAGVVVTGSAYPLLLAAIAAAAWLALESRAPAGPRPGVAAPAVALVDHAGRRLIVDSLLVDRGGLLLVFSDAACGACRELMPQLPAWQRRLGPELAIAVVSAEDRSAAIAYGVTATPTAVLIDPRGRIAAGPAQGADQIVALLERALEERALATGATTTVGRRAVLRSAAAGVAGITLAPLLESAAAVARTVRHAARPTKLKIDGAWLCDQRYALCTFAACKPSRANPNISVCPCKVKTGYSVGFKACEQRAPRGRQVHSNFSLQDVTDRTRTMKCSPRGLWVQCLDVVCEVDPHNPKQASCQCVNQRTKNFYTFAGDCQTKTCSTVVWSATTAPFPGGAQFEKGLKRLGIPFKVPKSCPAMKTTGLG